VSGKVRFKACGFCELSHSKLSVRLRIEPEYSCFTEYYYINVSSLQEVLRGKKRNATVFVLKKEGES